MTSMLYKIDNRFPHKIWVYLRFVLLLGIVFSLQQYSFVLLRTHNGYVVAGATLQKSAHLVPDIPQKDAANPLLIDAEVEVDEEEDSRHVEIFGTFFQSPQHLSETVLSACIKARLRTISSTRPTQSARPLFLLYHSWRSHLS